MWLSAPERLLNTSGLMTRCATNIPPFLSCVTLYITHFHSPIYWAQRHLADTKNTTLRDFRNYHNIQFIDNTEQVYKKQTTPYRKKSTRQHLGLPCKSFKTKYPDRALYRQSTVAHWPLIPTEHNLQVRLNITIAVSTSTEIYIYGAQSSTNSSPHWLPQKSWPQHFIPSGTQEGTSY